MVLEGDENEKESEAEDVELEGIEVIGCKNREGLWVVPEENRVEVRRQNHDSQVAAYWGRH